MEPGAIRVEPGAVTINILSSRKAPWIETDELKSTLKSLKPLEGLDQVPDAVRDKVINNEKVMQSVIKAILAAVDQHNSKYAEPPTKGSKAEVVEP
jgi:hypothetical protein